MQSVPRLMSQSGQVDVTVAGDCYLMLSSAVVDHETKTIQLQENQTDTT